MKNVLNEYLVGSLLVVLMGASLPAKAIDSASYFRVWQGFSKSNLNSDQFLNEIPSFMKATVDIYQEKALNNYIVVIPPANKPSYIPDELALVALSSKESYEAIRSTPEGRAYADRHWDVFNKENSKSAVLINYRTQKPSSLVHNTAYDMIGNQINWASGYNAVFIGTKKLNLSSSAFLQHLQKHIELAQAVMEPKGLRGYILIANDQYEIAYLNWSSKEAHDQAVKSSDGAAVFADARDFMDVLMYQEAKAFSAGQSVFSGEAYSTLQF